MRKIAAVLALILALALPASALAADLPETLRVDPSLTVTGIPASLDYGHGIAGDTLAAPEMSVAVTTNNGNGFTLAVTAASDFTHGSYTIDASQRRFALVCPAGITCTSSGVTDYTMTQVEGWLGVLAATSAPSVGTTIGVTPKVAVPLDAAGGDYTGEITIEVTTN